MKKLAEGKTKSIWETNDPTLVRIVSKDDITAGDGLKRDLIPDKAATGTTTTANVFRLLATNNVPTHFISQDSETSFIAKKAQMIPLECVARRLASGSFLKRHPEVQEGERFATPPVEFYFKDDSRHDPIIEYGSQTGKALLYDAKHPTDSRQPIDEIALKELSVSVKDLSIMQEQTKRVFEVIEKAWGKQNVTLVDLKIEFGRDSMGNIIVADVVDNDAWRIWPGGDKSKMLDKQRYRNGESLGSIGEDYKRVAKMTEKFVVN